MSWEEYCEGMERKREANRRSAAGTRKRARDRCTELLEMDQELRRHHEFLQEEQYHLKWELAQINGGPEPPRPEPFPPLPPPPRSVVEPPWNPAPNNDDGHDDEFDPSTLRDGPPPDPNPDNFPPALPPLRTGYQHVPVTSTGYTTSESNGSSAQAYRTSRYRTSPVTHEDSTTNGYAADGYDGYAADGYEGYDDSEYDGCESISSEEVQDVLEEQANANIFARSPGGRLYHVHPGGRLVQATSRGVTPRGATPRPLSPPAREAYPHEALDEDEEPPTPPADLRPVMSPPPE